MAAIEVCAIGAALHRRGGVSHREARSRAGRGVNRRRGRVILSAQMFVTSPGRSGVALAIALAAMACRARDDHRPIDAAARDAPPVPIDARPPAPDAAAPPAPTAVKLVASGDSTCAVMSDLTVRCWGGNAHGQLGDGLTADATRPIRPEIRAVKDLQLADGTACALLDDASVACWGRIGWHGHAEDVLRPTGVLGVIGVKQLFVLAGRACARVANDALVCWGNVDARGHFAAGPTNRAPTPVVGLDHVAGLDPDGAFSDDGRLWYWGPDGVPRRLELAGIQEIADRDGTVCGRLQDGRVMCAPSDRCGARPAPKPAAPRPAKPGKAATKSGTSAKPAATRRGKPAKPTPASAPAGGAPGDHLGEPADALGFTAARQLAFGLGFCVVTTAHKLQCGDGCRTIEPVKLERVDTVVGRCALLRSGTVTCFDDVKATAVPGITRASVVAVGRAHGCAIVDGTIRCWGADDHGQLGGFAITK
jgi:hypothetical protein